MTWLQRKKPDDEQVLAALRKMYGEECQHSDWVVRGYNTVGYGNCTLCDQELPLPALLMSWKARIEQETGYKVKL